MAGQVWGDDVGSRLKDLNGLRFQRRPVLTCESSPMGRIEVQLWRSAEQAGRRQDAAVAVHDGSSVLSNVLSNGEYIFVQ